MVTVSKFYSRTIRQGAVPSNPGNVDQPDAIPPVLNPPGSPGLMGGVGIKLNNQVIGGVKRLIESLENLDIPVYWQYNIHGLSLDVDGVINNDGEINVG